jgi:hypothetical protein
VLGGAVAVSAVSSTHVPACAAKEKPDVHNILLAKIDSPKILDLIVGKQTQLYTLWGVYTVVQFAAGGFQSDRRLSLGVGLAVLCGVWAFNLGHLGFVLRCIDQLHKLGEVLKTALHGDKEAYEKSLSDAFPDMSEGGEFFWRYYKRGRRPRGSYIINSVTHGFIDICASVALLIRIDNPWLHSHIPLFLT